MNVEKRQEQMTKYTVTQHGECCYGNEPRVQGMANTGKCLGEREKAKERD